MLKKISKFLLSSLIISMFSCASPTQSNPDISVDLSSLQIGASQGGSFTARTDKTFTSSEKITVKIKVNGLAVKDTKIKVNVDVFLKKDKEILGTESDILGKEGLSQTIPGIDSNYKGVGSADLQIGITPPSATKGDFVANLTVKDLNSSGKIASFETKFSIN